MMSSRYPKFLFWGPELVQIFNDGYRPSLGGDGRHVLALGARGAEFWTEIWSEIGPQIEQVMQGGSATWHQDQLLPIFRNGRMEDVYWTYSYSAAHDDEDQICGALVVCQETTAQLLLRQQLDVERAQLEYAFQQAPSFVAIMRGPPYVFEFVNDAYTKLLGHAELVGRNVFDVVPEARAQGFEDLLDSVVHTGKPFIAAISGYAELLGSRMHGPLGDQQAHYLQRIQHNQRHLLGLIDGLLSYAQTEAGSTEYYAERLLLHDIIASCEALTLSLVQARRLEFVKSDIPGDLTAYADREKTTASNARAMRRSTCTSRCATPDVESRMKT